MVTCSQCLTKMIKQMKQISTGATDSFKQSSDLLDKEIKHLEDEETRNLAAKEKVTKEILEKIKTCIAQIQEGKPLAGKFTTRETAAYRPIRQFPLKAALSFDNYLTAILDAGASDP